MELFLCMKNVQAFKRKLARIFDDDLRTKQWYNYVDYAIMWLILLSTLEVFLSTYDGVVERYGDVLHFIDLLTVVLFTIEITLRIWCADLINEKYKGVLGRVRYCFSFYGLIDVISTYPFYLNFIFPLPYTVLKSLRIARLLRIFRYVKAFNVLSRAIRSKKDEMWVSLQFLIIVTIILSFILFFVEHEMQPEVYDNGWKSVVWAFAQYIGDPGNFADTPPVTIIGRIIACIIGVLGIAIFAVPAGLIGSAFSDVMEEDRRESNKKEWGKRLHRAFERKLDRPTGFQIVPKYLSVVEIMARVGLKEEEIMEVVGSDNRYRLIDLSSTQPASVHPVHELAIEHFDLNTVYGLCIDRKSNITIFAPSNVMDPIIGWWAYYLAKIGGFNYVSREIGEMFPYESFYLLKEGSRPLGMKECMEDLNRLLDCEDKWVFSILAASGAQEPEYPTDVHFTYGAEKGDESYDDPNITLNDITRFDQLFRSFSDVLEKKYQISTDKQRYHNNASPRYFARCLEKKVNAVCVRLAWRITCWDMRSMSVANDFASELNRFLGDPSHEISGELKEKNIGYDGYKA